MTRAGDDSGGEDAVRISLAEHQTVKTLPARETFDPLAAALERAAVPEHVTRKESSTASAPSSELPDLRELPVLRDDPEIDRRASNSSTHCTQADAERQPPSRAATSSMSHWLPARRVLAVDAVKH